MTRPLQLFLARHGDVAWMLWENGARQSCAIRLDAGDPYLAIREAVFVIWGDATREVRTFVLSAEAVSRHLQHLHDVPDLDGCLRPPAGILAYLRERREAARP